MSEQPKVNLRCPYCNTTQFRSFDAVHFHIYGLTSHAIPSCNSMQIQDIVSFENWWSKYE